VATRRSSSSTRTFKRVVARSSFGTASARTVRSSTSSQQAARVVARANSLSARRTPREG
jgi:hypothetical protein